MSFRNAELDDFIRIEAPGLIGSSYRNVAYPLGCSVSELEVALGDGEFILQGADAGCVGFVRIKSIVADNCYLDLHVLDRDAATAALVGFLQFLRQEYHVRKFYAQILQGEKVECQVLSALGFNEEVRLREHVYINGRYHDLVMMGSEAHV